MEVGPRITLKGDLAWNSTNQPRTLAELLDILVKIFSSEALDYIKDCRTLGEVQSLEVFIRINLVIHNGNRSALYADCGKKMPHEVSRLAVLRLQERLREGLMAQG